jgi:hypothetical protein
MLMQGAGGQRMATLYDVKVFTKRCASGLGGVLFASDDQTSVDEALNEMLYCLMRPEAEWNRFMQNGKHPNKSQRPQNYPANLHLAGMTQSRAPQRKQPQPARLWVYVDWSNISLENQVSAERLLLMILKVQHGHPMCKFAGAKVYICTHTCACAKLCMHVLNCAYNRCVLLLLKIRQAATVRAEFEVHIGNVFGLFLIAKVLSLVVCGSARSEQETDALTQQWRAAAQLHCPELHSGSPALHFQVSYACTLGVYMIWHSQSGPPRLLH